MEGRLIRLAASAWLASILVFQGSSRAQESIPAEGSYAAVAEALGRLIERERADKGLPAVMIALVDGRRVVWSQGFGLADPRTKRPATAETVARVGSVSKLFTDLALMRLVERGEVDLDAPVATYLPDFAPENPFEPPITLRQLMAHRSGLVREPPVGHYFDPTSPSLAATVESLNRTRLVYAPGARTKYSNAGISVVGRVVEAKHGRPFERAVQDSVLRPLGMTRSGFALTPELEADLATAVMWTVDGRTFEAPTFALGTSAAGNLYGTVNDLGHFLAALFAGGEGPGGRVVSRETLESMWEPQFAGPSGRSAFGLGFALGELDGRRRVGHSGAVYGFATDLAALPEEELGVAVVATKDCANAVARDLADFALRLMLQARRGEPLPDPPPAAGPVPLEVARRVEGKYLKDAIGFELKEAGGRLTFLPILGGFRARVRSLGEALVVDDALASGPRLAVDGDTLTIGRLRFSRVAEDGPPPPAQGRWEGLIGEYGWDHNTLYILEKHGTLYALIEWFFYYPLDERSADEFAFPASGLYDGERLVFERDEHGRATKVVAAGVTFERRPFGPGVEDGQTFRIEPVRPVEDLREAALAATPPAEEGEFRQPELVDLTTLDPTIKLDIRYAGSDNFLGTPFYRSARAFLQRPAAEALARAHRKLADRGYGLLIHDAYRPWYVTRMFWDATAGPDRRFVADPAKGSRHNRGCAVDLTLYDLKTGEPVPMVGGYDEFSPRSNPDYPGGTSRQRWHRDLLRRTMEDEGFAVNEVEWWHFDHRDWPHYPILNRPFEEIGPDAAVRP